MKLIALSYATKKLCSLKKLYVLSALLLVTEMGISAELCPETFKPILGYSSWGNETTRYQLPKQLLSYCAYKQDMKKCEPNCKTSFSAWQELNPSLATTADDLIFYKAFAKATNTPPLERKSTGQSSPW